MSGKWKAILAVAVLAVGGHLIAANWAAIRDALGLDEVSPEHLRAIALTKSDYNLSHHLTNYQVIEQRVREAEPPVEEIGWLAERKLGDIFLVTYRFKEHGVERCYYFEVNVGSLKVRKVRGNPELERRYGVPAASPDDGSH